MFACYYWRYSNIAKKFSGISTYICIHAFWQANYERSFCESMNLNKVQIYDTSEPEATAQIRRTKAEINDLVELITCLIVQRCKPKPNENGFEFLPDSFFNKIVFCFAFSHGCPHASLSRPRVLFAGCCDVRNLFWKHETPNTWPASMVWLFIFSFCKYLFSQPSSCIEHDVWIEPGEIGEDGVLLLPDSMANSYLIPPTRDFTVNKY